MSLLLFLLEMTPMSLVLREVKTGYQLGHLRGKVNYLLFMDDLKLYRKDKKQIDTLVNTVRIFSEDTGMKFGISKCATLKMKRGIISKSEGMRTPNDELIKNIEVREGYKYLGILEADGFKNLVMKEKMKKECFRRIKKNSEVKTKLW